ncbi:hypothetical protein KY326_01680 [Candidatus Woesearchaeota archaeon]|nr:hypothetical protein [Candidatus Woesearchaeota archaeon]
MAQYYEELFIKTFKADTEEEIDRLCNNFSKTNMVKATHSNPVYDFHKKQIIFVYTLFYLPKDKIPQPEVVVEEKIETKIPKIIVPENEAQWADCLECKRRWKWTHYRLCPNRHGMESLPSEHHARYKEIWNGDGKDGNSKIDKPAQEV